MDDPKQTLERALSRMEAALSGRPPQRQEGPGSVAAALGVFALALMAAGGTKGLWWVFAMGVILAGAGGILLLSSAFPALMTQLQGGLPSPDRARIGLGATVAADAVVEPGASVEMGATVGRGAVVRSGAVVRMGAVVSRGAVVESGAVVSWGAVVKRDAVVGERAAVGAGAVVRRNARVPAGARLSPGSVYGAGQKTALPPALAPPAAAVVPARDPEDLRVAQACEKLEAELRASPARVREFLGGSDRTLASLRRTCEGLSARERALRAEVDPAAMARLEEERAALAARVESERDAQIRGSLQGALAAIDEARRQRDLVRLGADRLKAERTRLLYTLEALASQFVRLRSAGAEAAQGPDAEVERGVQQLRAELEAIAEALEQVARDAPSAMAAVAVPPPDPVEGGQDAANARSGRNRDSP
jgi:carbonic anhydrase/acetyltransferase-like protein (isoleucine patch superfamily)